jgi:hypothetical protein
MSRDMACLVAIPENLFLFPLQSGPIGKYNDGSRLLFTRQVWTALPIESAKPQDTGGRTKRHPVDETENEGRQPTLGSQKEPSNREFVCATKRRLSCSASACGGQVRNSRPNEISVGGFRKHLQILAVRLHRLLILTHHLVYSCY